MDPDLSDASLQEDEEDAAFHGWEEVPLKGLPILPQDPSPLEPSELSRPFKPYIFRRIPAYTYMESPKEEIPGFSSTTLLKATATCSNGAKTCSTPSLKTGKKKPPVNVSITLSSKREWRPSSQYFKPLQMGWVRELILPVPESSSGETAVLYHAPPGINTKKTLRTFKLISEIEAFLNTSNSGLSSHNFSFRKESMGAPSGQEIIHYENEVVDIFPPSNASVLPGKGGVIDPKKPTAASSSSKPPSSSSESIGSMKLKIKKQQPPYEENKSKKPEVNTRVINLDGDTNNLSSILSPMLKDTLTKKPEGSSSRSSSGKKPSSGSSSPFMNWPSSVSVSPAGPPKPTLRPKRPEHGSCSIHCGGGPSAFPSLSCSKCNSLFHPSCVGLGEGASYSGLDFVCNNCSPPSVVGEKENSAPPKKSGPAVSFSPVHTSNNNAPASPHPSSRNNHRSASVTVNRVHGPGYSQSSTTPAPPPPAKKLPLRPIESQLVVNIAGNKYLVVPSPAPPPSSKSSLKRPAASKAATAAVPLLLKPLAGSDVLPSFEVEEHADGKLLLVPVSSVGMDKIMVKRKKESDEVGESSPDVKRFCRDITSNLTSAYYALIHVFKYLSTQERIQVSRVCRLWRDLVYHPSLWKSVSLRSTKVYNWQNFTDYLNRTRAPTLDFRKISYVKSPDETWSDIFQVAPGFRYVTRYELPKISGNFLITLASKTPKVESISASNVLKEIDLEELVDATSGLRELRLKSTSGNLRLAFPSRLNPLLSLASLSSLSLLSVEDLSNSDLKEISALRNLTDLSLGECSALENVFEHLCLLHQLRNLRLESVNVDASLTRMEGLPLEKLELVDSHLVQGFGSGFIKLRSLKKLLLIPVYKDEVAAINAEIVDFALSMPSLSHFCLGLTNEWLDSMNSILSMTASSKSGPVRGSFPILVNGVCEMYSLYKLFQTLSAALPMSKVKVLRMSQQATKMQHIGALMS